jgi:hypothetical protein
MYLQTCNHLHNDFRYEYVVAGVCRHLQFLSSPFEDVLAAVFFPKEAIMAGMVSPPPEAVMSASFLFNEAVMRAGVRMRGMCWHCTMRR